MKWFSVICLILLTGISARAEADDFDYRAFGQMPVLHDGRIKPLDSLARIELVRIHGGASYETQSASQWLAGVFFKPAAAIQSPVFIIRSRQAALMLGLPARDSLLYSFAELAAVMPAHAAFVAALAQKDKNARSAEEAEVARIYDAINDFAELMGSFSLLLPLSGVDDSLRTRLHLPAGAPVTLFDLQKDRQSLDDALQEVVKRKGKAVEAYTPQERALAQAVSRLALQEALDKDNALVRVIPPSWGGEEWLSPWAVLASSSGSPQAASLLRDWRVAAFAIHTRDTRLWNATMPRLLKASQAAMPPFSAWRVILEYDYHWLNLLPLAAACYALGLMMTALRLARLAQSTLLAGLGLHGAALAMRMLILMRPPVSTLYESLIYVSFAVMAASVWLGLRGKGFLALFAGAGTGLMLLLASGIFVGAGDTLGVLVPVLNTNFWLATHVVCITTGYASALVAGAIAHIYLFQRAVRGTPEITLKPLASLLHMAALTALLFTATGTMLGGIWADQSWGRFWGWDPKENGALLIVLWLVWLLHGRIARQLDAFSFAACMAFLNIIVAMAWIGVNLLGVGLHSYGFTDAAATGLLSFCVLEGGFIAIMALVNRLRHHGEKRLVRAAA